MRTPICDELGIEFPIFAFTHCRDVVVAVSKAGGMGVLGAVGFSPEQLEVEMAWIDEHIGDHPYGIDIVIPQKYEGMDDMDPDHLAETLREMVPTEHLDVRARACCATTASLSCRMGSATTCSCSAGPRRLRRHRSTLPCATTRSGSWPTPSARRPPRS